MTVVSGDEEAGASDENLDLMVQFVGTTFGLARIPGVAASASPQRDSTHPRSPGVRLVPPTCARPLDALTSARAIRLGWSALRRLKLQVGQDRILARTHTMTNVNLPAPMSTPAHTL